jgi:hypothetical protein
LVVVGVTLFTLLCAALIILERFYDQFPRFVDVSATAVLLPGHIVDMIVSGNVHAGFSDWRDAVLIVTGSWIIWMLPLFLTSYFRLRKNGTKA